MMDNATLDCLQRAHYSSGSTLEAVLREALQQWQQLRCVRLLLTTLQ
jgi:hypothetical protein